MKDSPFRELGNIKEQYVLSRTLKQLGARVEYWDEDPDCGPGTVDDVEELLSEAEIDFMAQLFPNIFPYGDEPDLEKALGCYRSAIDTAPSPAVQAEIAYLLLRRAKVDPLPLSEFDFEETRAELHDAHYSSPLALPPEGRSRLIGLALDAYGRIYARNIHWLGCDHPEGIVNPWLQLRVMDGLRVIFRETDRFDLAQLICTIYDRWTQVMGTDFDDNPDARRLERHFAETRGYVAGTLAERTVIEAQRVAEQAGNRAYAQRMAQWIAKELGAMDMKDVAEYEGRLRQELGDTWLKLPGSVRDLLAQAEHLRSVAHPADFDWAPVALQYSRAVEVQLRETLGKALDRFLQKASRTEGSRIEAFKRDRLRGYLARDLIMEAFVKLLRGEKDRPPLREALPQFIPQTYAGREPFFDRIASRVAEFVYGFRNPAVHGAEPVAGATVAKMRRELVESSSRRPALLAELMWLDPESQNG